MIGDTIDHSFVIVKEGLKYVLFFFILFVVALFCFHTLWTVISLLLLLLSIYIHYNPERRPMEKDDNIILAPIDGVIKKINREGQSVTITISSPPCFVGVLRVPFDVNGVSTQHTKGFCFYREDDSRRKIGELTEVSFESQYGKIICRYYPLFSPKNLTFFMPPFPAQKGERMGFMSYGVLEMTIAQDAHLKIHEGDKIRGGQTTIGSLNR